MQAENERLREKVSNLESKVTSLQINQNKLEQNGRRNNIVVSGPATPEGEAGGAMPQRDKEQKRKGFKAETIKRLSPRSKYYCFSHSRASRI